MKATLLKATGRRQEATVRRNQGAGHTSNGRPARTVHSGRSGVPAGTLGGRKEISTERGFVLIGRRVRIKDALLHGGCYATVIHESKMLMTLHIDGFFFRDETRRLVCYTPREVDPVALTVVRRAGA